MTKLEKKLRDARWVCSDCGCKYGEMPEGHISSRHRNTCDVCGEEKAVTQPRDYLHFRKYLGKQG